MNARSKAGVSPLLRVLGLLRPSWRQAVIALVCILVGNAFALAVPRLLGTTIDAVVARGDVGLIVALAGAVVAVSLLRGLFQLGQGYYAEAAAQGAAYRLRNRLYDHLQRLSFAYHDRQQTGELMSRATSDVENVRMFLKFGLERSIQLLFVLPVTCALLISLDPPLALLSFAFLPVIIARSVFLSRRLRQLWDRVNADTGVLTTILQENLAGVRVVRAFGREDFESAKFAAQAYKVSMNTLEANKLHSFNMPFMNLMLLTAIALVLWLGGQQVIAGRMTPGALTQFIFYLLMLSMPVRVVGFIATLYSRATSSGERIFEVLDAPLPVRDAPDAVEPGPVRGHIRFENVSFSYGGASPALKDISFDAPPGQAVALLGATGSGKTTIVHLLPRFYDVTEGRITLDGQDLRRLKLESLRRNVGIVQQDVFLFSATIRENIAYGRPEATDDDVQSAARAARIHDFIMSLPDGYATWVGERGITLSGGQKQRVAIARTLLTDPRILILDDATSSVDMETEHLIQQALVELMRGRTTFVIAHRLSTVKRADLVLVLEDGRIAERGRHDELLARGGLYRRIYELQLREQEEAPAASRQE